MIYYYWADGSQTCYMVYIYSKNEQESLTRSQLNALAHVVHEEFK